MSSRLRSNILLCLLLFLALILQTTLVPRLTVLGAMLDLPLLFIAILAVLRGSGSAALWGAVFGLLLDLLAGKYIGLNALSLAAAGLMCGFVFERAYKGNILLSFATVGLGSAVYALVYLLVGKFGGADIGLLSFILRDTIPSLIYTAIVSLPIYIIANRSYQKHNNDLQ